MNQTWLVNSTLEKVVRYPVVFCAYVLVDICKIDLDHPYISFLFYGRDADGDFITVK